LEKDLDISRITEYLYIAANPGEKDVPAIQELNAGLVISMIHKTPLDVFANPPFAVRVFRTHDSFLRPIPVDVLKQGVEAALPVIANGQSVVIFCRQGRHRSVAMAACILIGMGRTASEAMRLIKEKRRQADPYIWYIQRRIRMFEKVWKNNAANQTGRGELER
jgi:hypothetical protein